MIAMVKGNAGQVLMQKQYKHTKKVESDKSIYMLVLLVLKVKVQSSICSFFLFKCCHQVWGQRKTLFVYYRKEVYLVHCIVDVFVFK